MTLPQIAEATGFCHQAYFGVVFKSHTGMTPSEFREENAIHAS
jgi:YesN/AraC family two-component response regulator